MKRETITVEPYMKEHAVNNAEAYLEYVLGLKTTDPQYEHEFKKYIQKFLEEAYSESMTPGRLVNNPTTPKVSKNIMDLFDLTNPKKWPMEMLNDQDKASKLSQQIRGSILSLVDAILKTKYKFEYKKNEAYREGMSDEEKRLVEHYRLVRMIITAILTGYIEDIFKSEVTDSNQMQASVNNTLVQQGIKTDKGVDMKKIKSKQFRESFAVSAYNVGKQIGYKGK